MKIKEDISFYPSHGQAVYSTNSPFSHSTYTVTGGRTRPVYGDQETDIQTEKEIVDYALDMLIHRNANLIQDKKIKLIDFQTFMGNFLNQELNQEKLIKVAVKMLKKRGIKLESKLNIKRIVQEEIYNLTGDGVKKIDTSLKVIPNSIYFLGASNSPEMILVTDINDKHITYYIYPFKSPSKIDTWVGKDLIKQGTLKALSNGYVDHDRNLQSTLRSNLKGRKGVCNGKHKLSDYTYIKTIIFCKKGTDVYGVGSSYGIVGQWSPEENSIEVETMKINIKNIRRDSRVDKVVVL